MISPGSEPANHQTNLSEGHALAAPVGYEVGDELYSTGDPFPNDRDEPLLFESEKSKGTLNRIIIALRFVRLERVFWDDAQGSWLHLSPNADISTKRVEDGVIRQMLHVFLLKLLPAIHQALIPGNLNAIHKEAKKVTLRLPLQQAPGCLGWVLTNIVPIPKNYDGFDDGLTTGIATDVYLATQVPYCGPEGILSYKYRSVEMEIVVAVGMRFPKVRSSSSRNRVRTLNPLTGEMVTGRGFPGLMLRPALIACFLAYADNGPQKVATPSDL